MSDQEKTSAMRMKVKVVPGSSKDEVVGPYGAGLKVRVSAAPEKGKANAAVIRLLAGHYGVTTKHIHIVSGHGSPAKLVEITR